METEMLSNNRNPDLELYHHGIKGMRWGVRRFQTKDGSLTSAGQKRYNKEMEKLKAEKKKLLNEERTKKKMDKLNQLKSDVDSMKKKGDDNNDQSKKHEETVEEKREKLLKSNNPKELYENKHLLTTQELNERINRIDTETRLKSKIVEEHQQSGMDRVNDTLQNTKNTLDRVTNTFKSIDNAYSTVANSAIGKTLAKQLGIETPKKEFNIDEFWKNRHKKTAQEMMEANRWLTAEDQIKNKIDKKAADKKKMEDEAKAAKEAENVEKRKKQAQKEVDDYNERWQKGKSEDRVIPGYDSEGSKPDYSKNNFSTDRVGSQNLPVVVNTQLPSKYYETPYSQSTNSRSYEVGKTWLDDYIDKNFKHSEDSIESLFSSDVLQHSVDELYHYGVKGMKWGVHRFYNKDGSRTADGKKRENEAKRYKNKDGTLTDKGNNISNRVFIKEYISRDNASPRVKKVIDKYYKYKTESQKIADEKYTKAMHDYYKYVDNYRKSNKDTQVKYEHDYDHTKKGKKFLEAVNKAHVERANEYLGEKWFTKYSKELANASMRDYMDGR